jgi:hypothetical protein
LGFLDKGRGSALRPFLCTDLASFAVVSDIPPKRFCRETGTVFSISGTGVLLSALMLI